MIDVDYESKKTELEHKRARLIREIDAIGPAPAGTDKFARREEMMADLRNTNAELKQHNIAEAERLREISDARKARGQQEHASNIERSVMKAPAPVGELVRAGKKEGDQLTRGEFLLKEIVRIGKTIATIKNPEPFTVDFKIALDRYIIAQRKHVVDRKAEKRAARIEADFENADPNGTTKEVEAKRAAQAAKDNNSEEWSKTWNKEAK